MSKVAIVKDNNLTRFERIKVGSFFSYGQCVYIRCSVESPGPLPRNTVRIHDGASIRFEPNIEVNHHENVEIHLK